MNQRRAMIATLGILAAILAVALSATLSLEAQQAPPPGGPTAGRGPNSMLPTTPPQRVSDHVYVLMAFPNIVFVIGSRATLVVDTGMGPKNGSIAAKDAAALAPGNILYLTTTHFHPEHASGEAGFPAGTILIRNSAQQKDLNADNGAMLKMFSGSSAENSDLLADVHYRNPDVVFDQQAMIDLGGGVTARLFWLGGAHTQGDELTYVEPDKTLISGDVVQNKTLPNLFGPTTTLKSWVNVLQQLEPLKPLHVVPDHSPVGDGSLLTEDYSFFSDLQNRALQLKGQGKSADEAGQTIQTEFKTKYPGWPTGGVPGLVAHVYTENP